LAWKGFGSSAKAAARPIDNIEKIKEFAKDQLSLSCNQKSYAMIKSDLENQSLTH
jgi:hypothetical protein